MTSNANVVVCALYKFVRLENHIDIRQPLLENMQTVAVKGTLLLAEEGINGTIAGTRQGIDHVLQFLNQYPELQNIVTKESFVNEMPFYRTKVKLKKEIVTMGVEGIDPNRVVGTYVKPQDWNALIEDPDVLLVDTRNDYETGIGSFKGALDPQTKTFREFPQYVEENLNPEQHKKVAMFCTGGIRCEKSTAYLKEQGFDEVYHLEGGILKYLEEVPKDESLWQGECFVFDNRVTVDQDLNKGIYDQCHACRRPITTKDKQSPYYCEGVSCHHCINEYSEEQRQRFRQREKQMQLAKQRGENHLGNDLIKIKEQRRAEKHATKEHQRGCDVSG